MVDATVLLLDRGTVRADLGYVLDGYTMATASDPDPEHDRAEFVVWSALIDHPEATVLWDTGSNPAAAEEWPDPLYDAFEHVDADDHDLRRDLRRVGYDLGDVDAVVTSHLHLDHAGGLRAFEGTDVPVYVHADELKYAYYSAKTDEGSSAYLAADFDRNLNWSVVHGEDHTLHEGVRLLHLPGHTPGLLGVRVDLPGETLLVAGDEAYLAANYREEVPLGPGLLWSERHWYDSLNGLKELERRTGADVLYGHDRTVFEDRHPGWNV
jgi:glyoxylase-like metal-dependent hydrolase (beta-lactamase superfamily II)